MKEIVFFDLETTGTDIAKDKIVQISAIKTTPDFEIIGEVKDYLVNPEVPIPKEASEVHGITDEMVADKPTFKQYGKGIYDFFDGCDVAGYNSNKFDVPMLSEEFARIGIQWPLQTTNQLDAYVIAAENEKRNLEWALQFYCGKNLEGAHDAKNDILATLDVLRAQKLRYEELTEMDNQQLSDYCGGKIRVDLAGTIVLNEEGIAVYNIGKDKGKSVIKEPGFGKWMLNQSFTSNTKNIIKKLLNIV